MVVGRGGEGDRERSGVGARGWQARGMGKVKEGEGYT